MVVLGTTVLVGTTLGGRYLVAPPVLLLCLGGVIALLPGKPFGARPRIR